MLPGMFSKSHSGFYITEYNGSTESFSDVKPVVYDEGDMKKSPKQQYSSNNPVVTEPDMKDNGELLSDSESGLLTMNENDYTMQFNTSQDEYSQAITIYDMETHPTEHSTPQYHYHTSPSASGHNYQVTYIPPHYHHYLYNEGGMVSHQHHLSNASTESSTSGHSNILGGSRHPSLSSSMGRPEEQKYKPLISTVYWDDEHTICYQVEYNGVLVSRREDNDYVNGTKLLNVAGLSRGKRDGRLKLEKNKKVVKVGSMNLKGVWLPFGRAYEIARNEGVDRLLYPLFRKDLKAYYTSEGSHLTQADVKHNR